MYTLQQKNFCINKNLFFLLLSNAILLLIMLHSNELWSVESRWATVTNLMLRFQDYLHPYLFNGLYYDKPLLSYWLIIAFAKLFGNLNTLALRLPSALSGIVCVYCVYNLGKHLYNEKVGILAGWLLTTTYFFIFWARTSSADMLNVAGILLAITWYMHNRQKPTFNSYLVFFTLLSLTSLCKGLAGFAIPLISVAVDVILQKTWKLHLNWKCIVGCLLGLIVYIAPFIASNLTSTHHSLQNSGISEVFVENIQRYFAPFDHTDPWYSYFIYIPIYTLPWSILPLFSIYFYCKNRKKLTCLQTLNTRWLLWFIIATFMFFTLSGSRRNYYILPLIPFLFLQFSDYWYKMLEYKSTTQQQRYNKLLRNAIIVFYSLFFIFFAIVQPLFNYFSCFGLDAKKFANHLNEIIQTKQPDLLQRDVILLNGKDNSLLFYLQIPHNTKIISYTQNEINSILLQAIQQHQPPLIIASQGELKYLNQAILDDKLYQKFYPSQRKDKENVVLIPK